MKDTTSGMTPELPMYYRALPLSPDINPVELWLNNKYPTENLYFVTIPKTEVVLRPLHILTMGIRAYFDLAIFVEDAEVPRKTNVEAWRDNIENYCKLIWLYQETYRVGKPFKNPVGAHWNPRRNVVVCHPGQIRMMLYDLFGGDSQEYIYFNTNGVVNDFMKDARPITDPLAYHNPPERIFTLVADHGTLVPHLQFAPGQIPPMVNIVHAKMRVRFLTNKGRICTNKPMNLPDWVLDPKGRYVVEWKQEPDERSTLRVLIALGCDTPSYEDDYVKVWTD